MKRAATEQTNRISPLGTATLSQWSIEGPRSHSWSTGSRQVVDYITAIILLESDRQTYDFPSVAGRQDSECLITQEATNHRVRS